MTHNLFLNWVNGQYRIHNSQLSSFLNEVLIISELMELVVYKHIYRERNSLAYELAKAGTLVQEGYWHIMEHQYSELSETIMPL